MLASIENKSAKGWTKGPASLAVNPSLKSAAAAIGWGLAIGACTMLAQAVGVIGSLYAAGVVSL
jgi:hypothetical protein